MGRYKVPLEGAEELQDSIRRLSVGDAVRLETTEDGATSVQVSCIDITGEKIGHLPSDHWLARTVSDGEVNVSAKVHELFERGPERLSINVVLEILTDMDVKRTCVENDIVEEASEEALEVVQHDYSDRTKFFLIIIAIFIGVGFLGRLFNGSERSGFSETSSPSGLNEAKAVTGCEIMLKDRLLSSRSFETRGMWRISMTGSDKALIERDYSATNGFGATIDSTYHCKYDFAADAVVGVEAN